MTTLVYRVPSHALKFSWIYGLRGDAKQNVWEGQKVPVIPSMTCVAAAMRPVIACLKYVDMYIKTWNKSHQRSSV